MPFTVKLTIFCSCKQTPNIMYTDWRPGCYFWGREKERNKFKGSNDYVKSNQAIFPNERISGVYEIRSKPSCSLGPTLSPLSPVYLTNILVMRGSLRRIRSQTGSGAGEGYSDLTFRDSHPRFSLLFRLRKVVSNPDFSFRTKNGKFFFGSFGQL